MGYNGTRGPKRHSTPWRDPAPSPPSEGEARACTCRGFSGAKDCPQHGSHEPAPTSESSEEARSEWRVVKPDGSRVPGLFPSQKFAEKYRDELAGGGTVECWTRVAPPNPPTGVDQDARAFNLYRYLDTPDGKPDKWRVDTNLDWRHPKAEHVIVTESPRSGVDPTDVRWLVGRLRDHATPFSEEDRATLARVEAALTALQPSSEEERA